MDANSMAFVETSIVTKEGILDSYPNEQQKDQSELHSTHRSEHRGGMQGDGRDDIGHLRATTSRRSGTHNDDASEMNTETRATGSLDDESNVANNDVSAVPCSLYQPTDLTKSPVRDRSLHTTVVPGTSTAADANRAPNLAVDRTTKLTINRAMLITDRELTPTPTTDQVTLAMDQATHRATDPVTNTRRARSPATSPRSVVPLRLQNQARVGTCRQTQPKMQTYETS